MISPITLPSCRFFHKTALKKNNTNFQKNNYQNNYFDFYKNNINFAGFLYQKPDVDFASTIEQNYFQLPSVRLKNGEIYQLLPDESQINAAKELYRGNSLLYSVSTGTGKTAVAHWAITKNLSENKKTIFTTPTKALANDKYDEFCEIYGEDKVGILTGDKKVNASAPVVIMTTEIYDKQVGSGILNSKNTGTVIYDEAHYIADDERGDAWENSIIESSKKDIQILLLSATIGNCEQFRSWIESLNNKRAVKKIEISPNERYVPQLFYSYFRGNFTPLIDGTINLEETFSKRQNRALETIYKIKNDKDIDYQCSKENLDEILNELKNNVKNSGFNSQNISLTDFKTILKDNYAFLSQEEISAIASLLLKPENKITKTFHHPHETDNYTQLVEDMKQNDMLPAIIYRLSKRKCEDVAKALTSIQPELDLTTEEEKKQIKQIISKYQKENKYLGIFSDEDKMKLIKGVGTHHSSKSPEYKALVEELFRKKLLKVVVATSTLGVGIDMPAKSTVISDMSYIEVNPDTRELERKPITINEFYQMAGRAGRRGQDSVGNVIIYNPYNSPYKNEETTIENGIGSNIGSINEEALVQRYLISKSDDLTSAFKPSVSALAQYYTENKTQDGFRDIVQDSFKVYLSKNSEAETSNLVEQFKKCSNILLKEGYIYRCGSEYYITPKGKILSYSQCSNPLMLSSLMYDKNIKDVSVEELCQIAGYIAGSQITPDISQVPEFSSLLLNRVKGLQKETEAQKQEHIFSKNSGYENAKSIFQNKENAVLKDVSSCNVDFDGKTYSNEYSGYVAYCWAMLNQHNENPIENFNKILKFNLSNEKETAKNTFKTKATEGNNYKIIAQSISILKQMQYICEYALENEYDFPEIQYWQDLKEKCEDAIDLMDKPPIEEFSAKTDDTTKSEKYAKRLLSKSGKQAKDYIEKGIENGFLSSIQLPNENYSQKEPNSIKTQALQIIAKEAVKNSDLRVRDIISSLAEQYLDEIKLDRIDTLETMAELIEEEVDNEVLKNNILYEIEKEIEAVYQEISTDESFEKLNLTLKKILEKKEDGMKIYDELIALQENSSKKDNDIAKFFIGLNEQTDDCIASILAGEKR